MTRGPRPYLLGAAVILAVSGAAFVLLGWRIDFSDEGPLGRDQPNVANAEIRKACWSDLDADYVYKVVEGAVDSRILYGCYQINRDGGSVFEAKVVDAEGVTINDPDVLKRSGAWPSIGLVKSRAELGLAWFGLVGTFLFGWVYYRRARPGSPPRRTRGIDARDRILVGLAYAIPIAGVLPFLVTSASRARKIRVALQSLWVAGGWTLFVLFAFLTDYAESWGVTVVGFLGLAFAFAIGVGRLSLAPAGFGAPDGTTIRDEPQRERAQLPLAVGAPAPGEDEERDLVRVERPAMLPSFADVGGMDELKRELRETFGLLLAFAGEADTYRITWNGVLLHGIPGVGKTFIARAVAGEFGLNFIRVSSGDLVSAYRGESSKNVDRAFRLAARNVPCVLFFDEFDSIAQNREDWPDQEARRTVNQLLQSLEEYRVIRDQVVVAATNSLDGLDPAVIRPGRFDRHIRVDLPDEQARKAVFAARLAGRPAADDLDLPDLARRSAGLTPAAIAQVVELGSLAAFKEAAAEGEIVRITADHLREALASRGGRDRPTVEEWSWDRLVLQPAVKAELEQLQHMVESPDLARSLGIEPPSGVLLTGPPGTGKTTIARVLAAEAQCSFYPVSAADITSKWLGESERNIDRLFRRARENAPSIVFIDEIDAIAGRRGDWGSYDPAVNQLLQAMDGIAGQRGVLVVAATNRPDQLDPALTRGGRLSRTIEIPLPDREARLRLLQLQTEEMPLVGVDLGAVADASEGLSGADLKALGQHAGLFALVREKGEDDGKVTVTRADVEQALAALRASKASVAGTSD